MSYAISLVGVTPRGILVSQSAKIDPGNDAINSVVNILITVLSFMNNIITKY